MKKLLLLICFGTLSFACHKGNVSTSQLPTAKPNAGTTKLPFGFRAKDVKDVKTYDHAFYTKYVNAGQPVLNLPPVKSAHYVLADKDYDSGLCYGAIDSKNIKLKRYKYRLPDHKGFQVYYMTDDSEKSQNLAEEFGTTCMTTYGNLIVYDSKTQSAQVLTVYYSFYIDSQQQRYFYIDNDYTIYMADESVSGGEDGADEPSPGRVYRAVINDTGGFSISTIFDPYK